MTGGSVLEYTYDTVPPTMSITTTATEVITAQSIDLTFASSKETLDFDVGDIVCRGGTISNFSGSGKLYSGTFISNGEDGEKYISVPSGSFTDLIGNSNNGHGGAMETWTLVFRHDSSSGEMFSSDDDWAEAKRSNPDDPSSDKFSILDELDSLGNLNGTSTSQCYHDTFNQRLNSKTGTFTFELRYPEFDKSYIWSQTCNPVTSACSTTANIGYVAIDIPSTGSQSQSAFAGLLRNSGSETFLDGNEGSGWWFSVGAQDNHCGGNSVPGFACPTYITELYVKSSETMFQWTSDTSIPTMTVSSNTGSSGTVSSDQKVGLRFISSEDIAGFDVEDVVVQGGVIQNLTGSGSVYDATLIPNSEGLTSVYVSAHSFVDYSRNENDAVSNTFEWTFDYTPPTMTITALEGNSGFTSSDSNLTLKFLCSEITENFDMSDVITENGDLIDFSGSGTTYTATFTPSGSQSLTKRIRVPASSFNDIGGSPNLESNMFEWIHDATVPTMTILAAEGSSGFISNDNRISMTFLSSEMTSNFVQGDVFAEGGNIVSFSGSGTSYTAFFEPTSDGLHRIHVDAGWYTDAASGENEASNTFEWTYDGTAPEILIETSTGNTGMISGDAMIEFTFTCSETVDRLESSHVNVLGGSISELSEISENVYRTTFTPSDDGVKSLSINADSVFDVAGNGNLISNTFEWTYDSTHPTMTISTDQFSSNDYTNADTVTLMFTSSESTNDFDATDVICEGGVLSDFSASDTTTYTGTFTPTGGDGQKIVKVRSARKLSPSLPHSYHSNVTILNTSKQSITKSRMFFKNRYRPDPSKTLLEMEMGALKLRCRGIMIRYRQVW